MPAAQLEVSMANIMEFIRPLLGGSTLDAASRFTGESRDATRRGMETAAPVAIAGLADYAADERNATALLGSFSTGDYPSLDAADFSRTLSDTSAGERISHRGEGFLQSVFGNRLNGVLGGVAAVSGTSRTASSRLMSLIMPLILGHVARHALANRLDARGLSRYLDDQKASVRSVIPTSLHSSLGFAGARETRPPISLAEDRERVVDRRIGERRGGAGRWIPWALAALAAALALVWIGSRRAERRHRTPVAPERPVPSNVEPAVTPERPTVREPLQPEGTEVVVPGQGVYEELFPRMNLSDSSDMMMPEVEQPAASTPSEEAQPSEEKAK
jgi:hypothetical protein